ncbi:MULTISPECIES: hypothetical protein [unclassified Sphingomonas]|jgi:hypothetical protein|nr:MULTISPECIES: hypothetical protein [unclassified Sphingomonas]
MILAKTSVLKVVCMWLILAMPLFAISKIIYRGQSFIDIISYMADTGKLPGFLIAVAAFLYFLVRFFYPAAVETFAPRTLRMVGDDLVIGRHILPLASIIAVSRYNSLLGKGLQIRTADKTLYCNMVMKNGDANSAMQAIAARMPAKGGGTA